MICRINNCYSKFCHVCSDDHSESVLSSMQTIMVVLLEESEDVREDLLFVILSILGRNRSVSIFSLCWHLQLIKAFFG